MAFLSRSISQLPPGDCARCRATSSSKVVAGAFEVVDDREVAKSFVVTHARSAARRSATRGGRMAVARRAARSGGGLRGRETGEERHQALGPVARTSQLSRVSRRCVDIAEVADDMVHSRTRTSRRLPSSYVVPIRRAREIAGPCASTAITGLPAARASRTTPGRSGAEGRQPVRQERRRRRCRPGGVLGVREVLRDELAARSTEPTRRARRLIADRRPCGWGA